MKYLVFLFFGFLFSCSDKTNKDILPPEKMEVVLWDLMRADEFALNFIKLDSLKTIRDESLKLYDTIFQIHKIDKDRFKKSFIYYKNNPKLLQPIFDSIEVRLNKYNVPTHPVIADSVITDSVITPVPQKIEQQ
jgi:hypothetical protein